MMLKMELQNWQRLSFFKDWIINAIILRSRLGIKKSVFTVWHILALWVLQIDIVKAIRKIKKTEKVCSMKTGGTLKNGCRAKINDNQITALL